MAVAHVNDRNGRDTTSENAPLVARQQNARPGLAPSNSGIEVDYGGSLARSQPSTTNNDTMDDNPTWASDPNSSPFDGVKDEESAGNYDDYSSSDVGEEEEEGNEFRSTDDVSSAPSKWDQESKKRKKKRLRKPARSCLHDIFVVIQILAVLANLVMIAAQVLPIVICDINIVQTVVRCYLAIFSFVFLLTELEVIQSKLLQNWISRGFLYTFLGVVEIEQYIAMIINGSLDSEKSFNFYMIHWTVEWTSFFINISSWWMIGTGCLYFVLGIFCLQSVRNRCREQYQVQLKRYKEEQNPPPEPFEG